MHHPTDNGALPQVTAVTATCDGESGRGVGGGYCSLPTGDSPMQPPAVISPSPDSSASTLPL